MSRARDLADGTFSGAVAAASGDFTGTIEAADFSDGTLTVGTEYVTNGSAKAWVNFDGTGTIAARDSLNLSSLTDSGTGQYSVNFTNTFAAANYAAFKTDGERGVGEVGIGVGSSSMICRANTSDTTLDVPTVTHSAHGDLA